jgi:hypothetical protein
MSNPNVTIELLLKDGELQAKLAGVTKKIKTATTSAQSFRLGSGFMRAGGVIVGVGQKLTALAKKFALIGTAAAAATSAVVLWASHAANQIERVQWKFDIIFSDIKEKAQSSAESIAALYKRNVATIQTSMANIGDVLKPVGASQETALHIGEALTGLATSAQEWTLGRYTARRASEAFMKSLVGEKEMLKELGIVIRDQDIKDYVEEQGWGWNQLNRMIATYNMILDRSQDMQKGAAGRIESFSERVIQLKEAFFTLSGAVGDYIEPLVTSVFALAGAVSNKLAEAFSGQTFENAKIALEDIAKAIDRVTQKVENFDLSKWEGTWIKFKQGVVKTIKAMAESLKTIFGVLMISLADTIAFGIVKGVEDGLKSAKGKAEDWMPASAIGRGIFGSDEVGGLAKGVRRLPAVAMGRYMFGATSRGASAKPLGTSATSAVGAELDRLGRNITNAFAGVLDQYDVYPDENGPERKKPERLEGTAETREEAMERTERQRENLRNSIRSAREQLARAQERLVDMQLPDAPKEVSPVSLAGAYDAILKRISGGEDEDLKAARRIQRATETTARKQEALEKLLAEQNTLLTELNSKLPAQATFAR